MAITNGTNLGLMVNAADGDSFGTDFRRLLRAIDALLMCSVLSRTMTAPPGSPANGDRYIIPAGATGIWSGKTNQIGSWTTADPANPSGVWEYFTPKNGFRVFSIADGAHYTYNSGSWSAM